MLSPTSDHGKIDNAGANGPGIEAVIDAALAKINQFNSQLNCFTSIVPPNVAKAAQGPIIANNDHSGIEKLSGKTFAVKDLFDICGEVTHAGSKTLIHADPAQKTAEIITRLNDAGAIYLGRVNMDEFAYGFVTDNNHFGITRNPYDTSRLAGGSSGGSAACVAAGLTDFSLGTDTNGSVRVPASLCGIFGLRPTFGKLSVDGVFPFVEEFDTPGIFARTVEDVRAVFTAMLDDSKDVAPLAKNDIKIATLDGWFHEGCDQEALAGIEAVSKFLENVATARFEQAEAARSAAFLITAYEGGQLHRERLANCADDYDPAVRDRLIAGTVLPDWVLQKARGVAQGARAQVLALLDHYDVLIAPATPATAPLIDDAMIELGGKKVSARANLGMYTQPFGPAGVPILTVPLHRPGKLPLGIQLVANHNCEHILFDLAQRLVEAGLIGFTPPDMTTFGGEG